MPNLDDSEFYEKARELRDALYRVATKSAKSGLKVLDGTMQFMEQPLYGIWVEDSRHSLSRKKSYWYRRDFDSDKEVWHTTHRGLAIIEAANALDNFGPMRQDMSFTAHVIGQDGLPQADA